VTFRRIDWREPMACCDRCGVPKPYASIKVESHTGWRVCPSCMDPPPVVVTSLGPDKFLEHPRPPRRVKLDHVVTAEELTNSQFKKR